MAGETIITVVGNLTGDPELKFTPSGAAVANFTVASTPRTFDRQTNEWKDGDTLFIRCAVWRQPAENVAESLQKGQRVIVQGALRVREYERQDGSRGTSVEMNVDEVGPSLRYASAKVTRNPRGEGGNFGGGGSGGGGGQQRPAADAWGSSGGGQSGPSGGGGGPVDPWSSGGGDSDAPPF